MNNINEYIVRSDSGNSYFKIVPSAGGLITNVSILGEEVLFFDRELFLSSFGEGEVDILSGGIPVLFPVAGSVRYSRYEIEDKEYPMLQHGFARFMEWDVVSQFGDSIVIRLSSNEYSKRYYPFDFEVEYTAKITDERLSLSWKYINKGDSEMIYSLGIHPFFMIDKEKGVIIFDVPGDKVYDYNQRKHLPVREKIVFYRVIDYVYDADRTNYGFDNLKFEVSDDFKTMVLWSPLSKEYLCMEPWTSKPYAFNSKETVKVLESENKATSRIDIMWENN